MIQDALVASLADFDQGVHLFAAVDTVLEVAVVGRAAATAVAGDDFVKAEFFDGWRLDGHGQSIGDRDVLGAEGVELFSDLAGLYAEV